MKIGMVSYATKQGLGYLGKSFYEAGVIDEVLLVHHGRRTTYPEWFDNKAVDILKLPMQGPEVEALLDRVDVMLFFETAFDWSLLARCKNRGVKTVMMPMYEWYPKDKMDVFDGYLCPSELDQEYFPGQPLFRPPVDPSTWMLHTHARKYLHNAGNVGHRNHKGTLELLEACKYLQSDLTITFRAQDTREFDKLLSQTPEVRYNPRVEISLGEIPRDDLFKDHDVMVAPEKFNGLSLPLQEAYTAGMLVMTTNRFPNHCYLPTEPLIEVESTHEAAIGGGYLPFKECVVNPETIAATMDDWFDRDITFFSERGRHWGEENSWGSKREEFYCLIKEVLQWN